MILFSPTGSIDRVWIASTRYYVAQPILLLVGKRERVVSNPSSVPASFNLNNPTSWPNWRDPGNIWVAINPQNGLVTTGEMSATNTFTFSNGTSPNFAVGDTITVASGNKSGVVTVANDAGPTGKITVSMNGWGGDFAVTDSISGSGGKTATVATVIADSRSFARDAQGMGGK